MAPFFLSLTLFLALSLSLSPSLCLSLSPSLSFSFSLLSLSLSLAGHLDTDVGACGKEHRIRLHLLRVNGVGIREGERERRDSGEERDKRLYSPFALHASPETRLHRWGSSIRLQEEHRIRCHLLRVRENKAILILHSQKKTIFISKAQKAISISHSR